MKLCECGRKHYGKGMCKKCYMKAYQQQPHRKKKHADNERERRAIGKTEETEKRRDATSKRKEWRKNYQQKYYSENREHLLEYQRDYRQNHRDKCKAWGDQRDQREKNQVSTLTPLEWFEILVENNHCCFYCKQKITSPQPDHVVPILRGGGYTKDNIVPSCDRCNKRKKTKTADEYRDWLISIGETPLF